MKRPLAVLGTLAATAGVLAGTMVAPMASASSHREAPLIAQDPYADLTDLYAFVSPDKPNTITFIVDAIPYEDPMGGPNYYKFDDKVRYELHIAQAGHNTDDITYRFTFATKVQNPGTFLYNTGPFAKDGDANLNVQQYATVTKVVRGQPDQVIGTNLPVAPATIGPLSNGGSGVTGNAEISTLPNGEGMFFAGQRGDPFFLDLGVFDLLALRPLDALHKVAPMTAVSGVNSFNGFNVHSIALQVPTNKLTTDGQDANPNGSNSVIGVWATTLRQQTNVLNVSGGAPTQSGDWVQVERLGTPLVNEVVVPLGVKDHFNATPPSGDAEFLPAVQKPELGGLITALYGVPVPPAPRNDLVTIFLTGIPQLNQPANVQASEMLRLNMGIAPSASAGQGNRMGVLGGDTAGYPNGRRLEDDVVDIAIQAVAGATPLTPDFNVAPNNALGDGVNGAAQSFSTSFPYVFQAYSGFSRSAGTAGSATGNPITPSR